MPDGTNAETSAAQKTSESTNGASNASATAQDQAKESPLTESRLNSILGDFRNSINADIRKATKAPEKRQESSASSEGEQVTLAGLKVAVETANREKIESEQRTREKLARAQYREILVGSGVNKFQAQDLAANFVSRIGKGLQIGEDDSVHVVESEGASPKPLADIVKSWLGTDHGKSYLPAKATVDAGGGGTGSGAASVAHPMMGMTYKQIMEGRGDLRASFFREHPQEFAAKEQEHLAGKR